MGMRDGHEGWARGMGRRDGQEGWAGGMGRRQDRWKGGEEDSGGMGRIGWRR